MARAQPADPAWLPVWDYMVQTVCAGRDGQATSDTPLGACPNPRKLREGERLPYHKRDWPGAADAATRPSGYQQSDSVPVASAQGPAVMQTYDFGDADRAFGRVDPGDGGQVVFFTPGSAGVGVTEDGGAGLQLFLGAACRPVDSWVIVGRGVLERPSGEVLARLTRRPDRCAVRLNQAWTRWWTQELPYRFSVAGRTGSVRWTSLLSEHFDAGAVSAARAMERMYFTRALGYTRWEAWESTERSGARAEADRLAATGRCVKLVPPPADGWVMTDCREWTQLVPAADPAGDPPFGWLDRLRIAPATAALFGAGAR